MFPNRQMRDDRRTICSSISTKAITRSSSSLMLPIATMGMGIELARRPSKRCSNEIWRNPSPRLLWKLTFAPKISTMELFFIDRIPT